MSQIYSRPTKGQTGAVLVLLLIVSAIAVVAFLWAFPGILIKDSQAERTLEKAGFTQIEITSNHWISPHWFGGCGKDDTTAFSAYANNPAGKRVKLIVCESLLFKGGHVLYP